MTFMAWTEDLAVGLGEVDAQHRWLLDTTNQLHDALQTQAGDRATIGQVLEGLMDYTVNHFVMEEDLFQRHRYPDAAAHVALHNQFTAAVMKELAAFEAGQDVGPETLALLRHWLVEHIMKVDRAYVPYLSEQGVR